MKSRHFHATKRFIGDLGDIQKDIYPPELQLKVEHSGTHATFLNLDITVKNRVLRSIFYCAVVGEFLRIASSSLLCKDFNEKAMELLNRMKTKGAQGVEKHYPKSFQDMIKRLPIWKKL